MSDAAPPVSAGTPRTDRIFPTLSRAQIARIAAQGKVRHVRPGEVLVEAGDQAVPFSVITSGQVEIVQPSRAGETPIAVHGPGQFTVEANMLCGRRALFRARATAAGETLELERERADVRGRNVERIASAVGEGSIAVALVHQMLQER